MPQTLKSTHKKQMSTSVTQYPLTDVDILNATSKG